MYKQIILNGVLQNTILRTADNVFIPYAPDNTDFQQYLAWVAQGNTPTPADNNGQTA